MLSPLSASNSVNKSLIMSYSSRWCVCFSFCKASLPKPTPTSSLTPSKHQDGGTDASAHSYGVFPFCKRGEFSLILSFFFFCNLGHGAVDRYSHGKHEVKQMGAEHMLCICNVRMSDMGIFLLQVGDRRPSAKLHIAGKCKWASSPSDCS